MDRLTVTWDDVQTLCDRLADQLAGQPFEGLLAVTRGGLIPAGLLAYRLNLRDILVAAMQFYDDNGARAAQPTFLQFPAAPLLCGRRILVVDEVWDSGRTITAVCDRVRDAGGAPVTAVLHHKPQRSEMPGRPDFMAQETNDWIVYPWTKKPN